MKAYHDAITRLLKDNRFYLDPDDQRIKMRIAGIAPSNPWIYCGDAGKRRCQAWHDMVFEPFRIIPHFCQNHCWKVVIKPQTVRQLFWLLEVMEKHNLTSKCGVDGRTYTFGIYSGYLYGESLKVAHDYYRIFSEEIAGKMPIAKPKRGCTEFENFLPSDQWTEKHSAGEKILKKFMDLDIPVYKQPDWVKERIKVFWIQTAYRCGDATCYDFPEYMKLIEQSRKPILYDIEDPS